MTDHVFRWVLDLPTIKAGLFGDVLCVELRGRFTARRLSACLYRLREAVAKTDYGALVINVMRARMDISVRALAAVWHPPEVCPLAARPCAVVYDATGFEVAGFYCALASTLAGGQPAVLMGAFEGGPLADAVGWAAARARNFRAERARAEIRANSPGSSGKRGRKPASGAHRS